MRFTRAYTDAPLAPGHKVRLDPVASAHLTRVLRLGADAPVVVFNGDGRDYHGRIARAKKDEVEVALEHVQDAVEESPLHVTLGQCIARGEKMDWIVQKATELGVAAIVPIESERTEVRLDPERAARRRLHWRGVAIAACEQCGRARLPDVAEPIELAPWLVSPRAPDELALVFDPDGQERLRAMPQATRVRVLIGPEGGLSERELKLAADAGFRTVRLGARVLRTDTAGAAALAALSALFGDLG
jgi:16S rRNA (uracil1498-N3)-methyltransferase